MSADSLEPGCLERVLKLAPFLGLLLAVGFHGGKCRLDSERLKAIENLTCDDTIDAQAAERDAAVGSHGSEGATADVALCRTARVAVGDLELLTAPGAAEEARQQGFATSDRATAQIALAVGVVGNHPLIPLELQPRDIPFMVILDQNIPVFRVAMETAKNALASLLNCHPHAAPPEDIGAGIDGVRQHVVQRVIDWCLPLDRSLTRPCTMAGSRMFS